MSSLKVYTLNSKILDKVFGNVFELSNFKIHISHYSKCGSDLLTFPQHKDLEYCKNNNLYPIVEGDYTNIDDIFLKCELYEDYELDEKVLKTTNMYIKVSMLSNYLDLIYKQIEFNSFFYTIYKVNNEDWVMIDTSFRPYSQLHTGKGCDIKNIESKYLLYIWPEMFKYFKQFINSDISITITTDWVEGNSIICYSNDYYKIQVDSTIFEN